MDGSSAPQPRPSPIDELIIGDSAPMRRLRETLVQIAGTNLSVLIEGETGTGKDLVATAIHRASARSKQPFVVFDCSATAPNLIESDLFGHAHGAFTGAVSSRRGALGEANGGTLFLDEIGELPLTLQPKLLRCLQNGEYRSVGSDRVIKSNVRLIAATHRDLQSAVAAGSFREDLYYRLVGVTVHVPPLRHRLDDLAQLSAQFAAELGQPAPLQHIPTFREHKWPGNIRELRNEVCRALALPGYVFHPTCATASSDEPRTVAPRLPASGIPCFQREVELFQKTLIHQALQACSGNKAQAALLLGLNRTTLVMKMQQPWFRK